MMRVGAKLAHAPSFSIQFLQNYLRKRWSWGIAQLSFTAGAIRQCDVNNSSGNSVTPANWVAIFVSTADLDFYSFFRHFLFSQLDRSLQCPLKRTCHHTDCAYFRAKRCWVACTSLLTQL